MSKVREFLRTVQKVFVSLLLDEGLCGWLEHSTQDIQNTLECKHVHLHIVRISLKAAFVGVLMELSHNSVLASDLYSLLCAICFVLRFAGEVLWHLEISQSICL